MNVPDLVKKIKLLPSAETITYDGSTFEVKSSYNSGATDIQMLKLWKVFNGKIPDELDSFLKLINGCTLFNLDNVGGFQLLSVEEIFEVTADNKDLYDGDWDDAFIIFCTIIGEGNYFAFKILDNNKYELVDCFHEENPHEWRAITLTFTELIHKIIDSKGNVRWFEYYK